MNNREIDKQIAEKIMGWKDLVFIDENSGLPSDYYGTDPDGNKGVILYKHYSTRPDHAFEVVEKMQENDFWFSLSYKTERVVENEMPPEWWARFRCIRGGTRPEGYLHSDTPAMAICLAALKTIKEPG